LPDSLRGTVFYEPGPFGFEKDIAKRLAWWNELKGRVAAETNDDSPADNEAGREK
jgi:putative ATPase